MIFASMFFGCEKEAEILENENGQYTVSEAIIDSTNSSNSDQDSCYTIDLIAAQHFVAGNVSVDNDGENLVITFTTNDDWTINATHLYIGACEDIPLTGSGNPKIGNFEYHSNHSDGTNQVVYTISLEDIPEVYCLAAHAEVISSSGVGETAWGAGDDFSGNSWAMFIEDSLTNCNSIQPE